MTIYRSNTRIHTPLMTASAAFNLRPFSNRIRPSSGELTKRSGLKKGQRFSASESASPPTESTDQDYRMELANLHRTQQTKLMLENAPDYKIPSRRCTTNSERRQHIISAHAHDSTTQLPYAAKTEEAPRYYQDLQGEVIP